MRAVQVAHTARDEKLTLSERLEPQPLVAEAEATAPGAVNDHCAPLFGVTEQLRELPDAPRTALQVACALLRRKRPPH
jgi:hypothetical protein